MNSYGAQTMAAASSFPLALAFLCLFFPCASSLSFSLDFSKTGDPCGRELVCKGDASFRSTAIELTSNDSGTVTVINMSQGRVWYATPVPLWDATTGEVASFTTTFSFNISWMPPSSPGFGWGDGMAFFLARYSRDGVLDSSYGGGLLGLFSNGNHLNATGDSQVVAVEFDTALNPDWDDGSIQHVGIDVNSIKSVSYTNTTSSPGKNLTSGFTMTSTVRYDSGTRLLAANLKINDTLYRVNATVDLKKILYKEMAVGFTAGTGFAAELHRLLSWSFNSTLLEKEAPSSMATQAPVVQAINSKPSMLLLKVLIPVALVSVIGIVGLLQWLWLWRKRRRTSDDDAADFEIGVVGPRRYLYHELATATGNFAEKNKLGQGGFGSVYEGRLLGDDQQVAIKKFSRESSQGRKEFEAEVKIISRLRHRNLVQLLGWCDCPKGLLLVYELVPEGSLDRHIYNNDRMLTWSERYNIILGLGSALRYLHLDWEQCVVHGDIKPSNIMLDSSHNTKLGDFGLARLVDHGTGPQSTGLVQGTVGYIDPEFVNTFQRSTQSDVYSFAIVLLEIVSGRKPVYRQEPAFALLKWVWSLYSQDAILDAADPRLRTGRDDTDERRVMKRALVVGLWCALPDPAERPSVALAMHTLQSEDAGLPALSPPMHKLQVAPPSSGAGEDGATGGSSSSGVHTLSTISMTPSPVNRL